MVEALYEWLTFLHVGVLIGFWVLVGWGIYRLAKRSAGGLLTLILFVESPSTNAPNKVWRYSMRPNDDGGLPYRRLEMTNTN